MIIYFFSFDVAHPLGDSATHPIEPQASRLGRKLLLAGSGCASSSPLQGATMPHAWPAQAVQPCAGRFGAVAFALLRRAANGPLGRVQLRNLGAMRIKLTNMLSVFADCLGQQAPRFEPVVGHGCSPKANLIFSSLPGKMPGLKQVKSLQIMRRTQTFKVIRREGATPTNS
ncbi:MAG TPA: hypothetical protein PLB25_19440, partial [Rhodoferax sp.]|nr:hypothetical protein [Rhodoferax sp.]